MSEASALFHPDSSEAADPSQADVTATLEGDIQALLRALPTRQNIKALILRVEETHRQDIQAVRTDINVLAEKVNAGEESVSSLEQWVGAFERAQNSYAVTAVDLQLPMEDLEDRSRRNDRSGAFLKRLVWRTSRQR